MSQGSVQVESRFIPTLIDFIPSLPQVMLFYFAEKVGMLDLEQFGGVKMEQNSISQKELIEIEVDRLSRKYKKDFLDCEDIIKITGLGRDNVRTLMKSEKFPITKVGKRQVVSIINFVTYITSQNNN